MLLFTYFMFLERKTGVSCGVFRNFGISIHYASVAEVKLL